MDTLILIIAGATGAFAKDIIKDNKVLLPKIEDGSILLGFVGGIIIGAAAGYIVDNDPITAFLAGYTGSQIIENLLPPIEV